MTHVEMFPIWRGGRAGYLYNVLLDGEMILERVRDPECDLARVLLARGLTGKVTVHDGKTGKPRAIVDIDGAARLRAADPDRRSPHFQKWEQPSWVTPQAGEEHFPDGELAELLYGALAQ